MLGRCALYLRRLGLTLGFLLWLPTALGSAHLRQDREHWEEEGRDGRVSTEWCKNNRFIRVLGRHLCARRQL